MKNLSLQLRLILLFSAALLSTWFIASFVVFFLVNHNVREVYDSQQLMFARRLASFSFQHVIDMDSPQELPKLKSKQLNKLTMDNDAVAFAIFNRTGRMLMHDGEEGKDFIYHSTFVSVERPVFIGDVHDWRIIWLLSDDHKYVVAVGQEIEYRENTVWQLVSGQLFPWLIMLPALMIIIVILVNRELRPLKLLALTLSVRQPDDDTPLDDDKAPGEVKPFIHALNSLFKKVNSMLIKERRFTSDAAHELRTPLASLKIQSEVALLAEDDIKMRQHALQNLITGVDRANRLVEQLLTLSRLDSLADISDVEIIDWSALASSVIYDLKVQSQKRNVTVSLIEGGLPANIKGHPLLLSLLVRNLVDNALRYSQKGGKVDITLCSTGIIVSDNGPGVSSEYMERLGQRFFRPPGQDVIGSGLGLSIVKRIADLHGIETLFKNNQQGGFRVVLSWN